MAKTIEERAIAFMNNYPNMDDSYYDYYVRDGYIQGATDQDQIARQEEREKAIRILRQLGVFDMLAAEEGLSAACMEEQFKQSMEGDNNGK